MRRGAVRWGKLRVPSTARIAALPIACGTGSRSGSRPRALAAERPVDFVDVGVGKRADCLLELEAVDDEVVIRLRQVEPRLVDLLLLIEHVEIRADADFES